MNSHPNYPPPAHLRGRNSGPLPPPRPSTSHDARGPRTFQVTAPPRVRPEDAQPSEAVTSNRRPTAPPPVVPTSQPTTFAGGWSNSNPSSNIRDQNNMMRRWSAAGNGSASYSGNSGQRWNSENGIAQYPNRPRPQTTAGGWSSSTTDTRTANGTVAGKGKERQWGVSTTNPNSSSSTNSSSLPTPTPVPVPINPRPKIWISQLPPSVTEDEIRTVFSPFGQIDKVTVNLKPNANYAYSHVTYTSTSSAHDAITSLNLQPFPSINGIGPSRPIRVSYATPPRTTEATGNTGRSLAVTTEPPVATNGGVEVESRLFRARDTPEYSQSQIVKRENESPVKRMPLVHEEEDAGERGRGRGSRGGRSRSGSSPKNASPDSLSPSPHSARRSSLTSAPSQPKSFPPFINPPTLSLDSISFPPTRPGIFDSSPLPPADNNPRRYSLSYYFSNRLVSFSLGFETSRELAQWLSRSMWYTGDSPLRCKLDKSTVRLSRVPAGDPREGEEEDDEQGTILTFVISVGKKVLKELERNGPWTEEEEDLNKRKLAESRKEIRNRLKEIQQFSAARTDPSISTSTNGFKTYPYIQPPSLSFNQIPLTPSRLGTLNSHESSPTYVLRYIYPLELLSNSPSTTSEFESKVKERLKASGMKLISLTIRSSKISGLERSDVLLAKDGEGVTELSVGFISNGLIGTLGRLEEWNQKEQREAEEQLEQMRRIAKERFGPARGEDLNQEEEEQQRREIGDEPAVPDLEGEGPQNDGTVIERIPLPPSLVGAGPDQLREQTLLRVGEVKKRSMQGKVVLSSSIMGEFIVINYFLEEAFSAKENRSAPQQRSTNSSRPTRDQPQEDTVMAEGEDIKPVITNDGEEDMEIDQLDSATPEPNRSQLVKFPLGVLPDSRADSMETFRAAKTFIDDYFRRFDSARGSLESVYTKSAAFTFRVDTRIPRRLNSETTLFPREWLTAAKLKIASTPTPITNLIKSLPAVSHNFSTMIFNARMVPEVQSKRRDRAPILLHLVGEFEEFTTKTIRRFERSFVLVPQAIGSGVKESPGDYIIESDHLVVGHRATSGSREVEVMDPPFQGSSSHRSAPPPRAPPVVQPHSTRRFASTTTSTFSPPPIHQPQEQTLPQTRPLPQPQSQPQSYRQIQPTTTSQAVPVASTSSAVAPPIRTSEKRPRPSSTSISISQNPVSPPTSSSPVRPLQALPPAVSRRLSQGEVLELSDSESAASHRLLSEPAIPQADEETSPSMSPELPRPAKRPNLANGNELPRSWYSNRNEPEAREPSVASSVSVSHAPQPSTSTNTRPVVPSTVSQPQPRSFTSLGKRKANDSTTTSTADQVPMFAGGNQFLSAADLQRFISEQVKKEVEEKLRKARASESSAAKKKPIKSKEKEEDKSKEKKKKTKEKKDKMANGLGTGFPPGDSRIVIASSEPQSILHGFDGRSNKLRGMIQTGDAASFLSVSFLGDIAEWSLPPLNSSANSSITKLYSSNQDKYRVDDFTYNSAKDTLLVGYLGAKEGKEMACPPNQVVLYKRDVTGGGTTLIETRLTDAPHVNGGVTAIMALPNKASTGRLRFVTGGEDKKVYLWTRQRSTQEVKLEKFVTEHTSMITSFAFLDSRNELISAGKDRRVVTYDTERRQATWQTALSTAVMSVSSVLCDPNLIMSRLATPSDQFLIHDRRVDAKTPPVASFGYDLPPHRSTNGTLLPTNMGRYPRGDQMDTVVVFPDHDQGVKMWDLRQIKANTPIVKKQDLGGLGRSKVVQASFKGRNELCLMELAHFTRLSIKG
ncbi:hypothetical protein JCM5350_007393 [Sporobolomyces pararoseus]